MSINACRYFPSCKGCDNWHLEYDQQKKIKIDTLSNLLKIKPEMIDFIQIKEFGLRHRFDFTFKLDGQQKQSFGLYDENRKIVDLSECLQLSLPLQKAFEEFRKFQIKTSAGLLKKGSVRLRVGPSGLKGCWLDLANVDIKALLDDFQYLNNLLEAGFKIELGQKGKSVKKIAATQLKLSDPQTQEWFQTYSASTDPIPMQGLISDFTQPSWWGLQKLVETVLEWTDASMQNIVEFGAGLGSFTLPLLKAQKNVEIFEISERSVQSLLKSAKSQNLEAYLKINIGDFQNQATAEIKATDLVLVNPPRSGLKKFTEVVVKTKARFCIYISCFPESMAVDLEQLQNAGYQIEKVKIVDQFPQTKHFETCVLLKKITSANKF